MKKGAYAVIFSNRLRDPAPGYEQMADSMDALAAQQPGYLGHMSVRGEDRRGMTVSYWESEEAIITWKAQAEHAAGQKLGRDKFYEYYRLEVCRIERLYDFEMGR